MKTPSPELHSGVYVAKTGFCWFLSFQSSRNRMQFFERKKEISGVSKNRAFEKSGVKLQCLTEANPRETTFGSKNREFRITEYSKNRDSTVYPHASKSCVLRGGANSKNICFGRTAKSIRGSEDIAGNREPREIIRETANNIGILHNIFGACI